VTSPRNHFLDVEFPPLPGIERTYTAIEFFAKVSEIPKVGSQLFGDPLLFGLEQLLDFRKGLRHPFCHGGAIYHRFADAKVGVDIAAYEPSLSS
jgi:hypothetical protein